MNHRRHVLALLAAAAVAPLDDQPAEQAALKTKTLGVATSTKTGRSTIWGAEKA